MIKIVEEVSNVNNLYQSQLKTCKNVNWKASVQSFEINFLRELYYLQKELKEDSYEPHKYHMFQQSERGRIRNIRAFEVRDRVVKDTFCDKVLFPKAKKYLIYDNGASLKGKGVSFSRQRFENHVRNFYSKHGTNGYILFIDISKFFDNIKHDKTLEIFSQFLNEEELKLLKIMCKGFEFNLNISEEELNKIYNGVFNSLDYIEKINGNQVLKKSMAIGSPVSQIVGITYPNIIDNYCKIVKSCKWYGRYMDDTYIIHQDKNFLEEILKDIRTFYESLGLKISEKKTKIVSLKKQFSFLKINYFFNKSKLVRKIQSETLQRKRRKLRKYKKMFQNDKATYKQVKIWFASWLGNYKKFDSGYEILKMKRYFYQLFKEEEYEFTCLVPI